MSVETAARRWFDDPQVQPLGAGHIHDTFLVTVDDARFVLQRVNESVFADPELVMAQTQRLLARWRDQHDYVAPVLQRAKSGAVSERVDGGFWRVWRYVDDTAVVDPIENTAQARAAGAAFAALQKSLRGLAGPPFVDTIAGFLQLEGYLQAYAEVADEAPADLRAIIDANRGLARQFGQKNAHIHGDCKVNNLLFDAQRERVVAVIDFDTAMYGHWAWDFGDLVRSVCFSLGRADADYFAACLDGFRRGQPLVNVADSAAAPAYLTLMLGVRFLTDHLLGDRYFRVTLPGDNLVRAREQFGLFDEFMAAQPRLLEAAQDILHQGKT